MPLGLLHWHTPNAHEWLALAATSLLAIGAQLTMTHSLRWVDAMTVGVISQLAVLVSMILGALFLHEEITSIAAIGAALSIAGVAGVTWATSLTRRPLEPEEAATVHG
jgi:drug/metabolite transporter (DMT)-like permease